jgi:hypothetical protein
MLRVAFTVGRGVLDRHVHGVFGVGLPAPQRIQVEPQLLGDFPVGSGASEDSRERLACLRDLARLAADRPWHVILAAKLVEDRAANARHGERAEREAA